MFLRKNPTVDWVSIHRIQFGALSWFRRCRATPKQSAWWLCCIFRLGGGCLCGSERNSSYRTAATTCVINNCRYIFFCGNLCGTQKHAMNTSSATDSCRVLDIDKDFVIDEDDYLVLSELLLIEGIPSDATETRLRRMVGIEKRRDSNADNILSLPASIEHLKSLPNLTDLELSSDRITPSLDLSSTRKFSKLPEEIGNLFSLNTLNLMYSKITFLPPSIGRLQTIIPFKLRRSSGHLY